MEAYGDYLYLAGAIAIIIIEFLLGKTDKFKANSTLELILNLLKSFVSKEEKKK